MKHNTKAFLEASGNYRILKKTGHIEIIENIMRGYAQVYHNNEVKKFNISGVGSCVCEYQEPVRKLIPDKGKRYFCNKCKIDI